jgi:uncharacterized phage-associated protein
MALSARDVAAALRQRLPGVDRAKLHKLLYYSQGWHLASTGEPMFHERIEAWAYGPVVATLWIEEQHDQGGPTEPLGPDEFATLEYVLHRYGRRTAQELIDETHDEEPWLEVRPAGQRGTAEITPQALKSWFERQPDHQANELEAERHRERADIYSFDAPPIDESLREALDRARGATAARRLHGG